MTRVAGILSLVVVLVAVAFARRSLALDLYIAIGAAIAGASLVLAIAAPPMRLGPARRSGTAFVGPAGLALGVGLVVIASIVDGNHLFAIAGIGILVAWVTYLARSLERSLEPSSEDVSS